MKKIYVTVEDILKSGLLINRYEMIYMKSDYDDELVEFGKYDYHGDVLVWVNNRTAARGKRHVYVQIDCTPIYK